MADPKILNIDLVKVLNGLANFVGEDYRQSNARAGEIAPGDEERMKAQWDALENFIDFIQGDDYVEPDWPNTFGDEFTLKELKGPADNTSNDDDEPMENDNVIYLKTLMWRAHRELTKSGQSRNRPGRLHPAEASRLKTQIAACRAFMDKHVKTQNPSDLPNTTQEDVVMSSEVPADAAA